MTSTNVDWSILDTPDACQVCITEKPTWFIPTSGHEKRIEQADLGGRDGDTDLRVCDRCLSLVEEYHEDAQKGLDALTQQTLESMFAKGAFPGFGKLSSAQRKRAKIQAHMTVRKIQLETLQSITGDPVRLAS